VYDGDGQRVLVKQTTSSQTDKTIYIGGYFEVFIKASYSATPTPVPNCGVGRSCIYLPLNITTFVNPTATPGQVWKSYYSTGAGQVVRVQDNAGMGGSGLFWLYTDHLGSTTVTARIGGFEAALVSTLSYTAWGETRASSGITPTSLRYTGQREAEAGLYFYKARWYDPALGRFAQADSIVPEPGSSMGWDRFVYVNNNPVNANDPSGHFKCTVSGSTVSDKEGREESSQLISACQQTIEEFLKILREQGGEEGAQIEKSFRDRDTITDCTEDCYTAYDRITIAITDKIPGGSNYAAGDGKANTIYVLRNVMKEWVGQSEYRREHAGALAHEYVHIEQGLLAGSVRSEAEAWYKQSIIYNSMGIEGSGHMLVGLANGYRNAYFMNDAELKTSQLRKDYSGSPLYSSWGWVPSLSPFFEDGRRALNLMSEAMKYRSLVFP
jgi:RHS repeat-associated protein